MSDSTKGPQGGAQYGGHLPGGAQPRPIPYGQATLGTKKAVAPLNGQPGMTGGTDATPPNN